MSTPAIGRRRPYVRPMKGWWRRNDFYIEYMIHEATAVFVAAYAVVLLVGLLRLSEGEAAWNAWLQAMRSPYGIVFHVIAFIAISYHAWTWFQIMPRTLPPITIRGNRLPAAVITYGGLAAMLAVSIILFGLVWSMWS